MIDIDGEPWFPAKDVCDALGIKSPSGTVLNACPEHQRQHISKSNLKNIQVSFPNRGMLCVNESGANALVFTSRKPEARAFRRWVTSVVLPSISKDFEYEAVLVSLGDAGVGQ
ncbi:MAG: Bro-N domain-containing protein [Alphaproteobacteria bacterium]|nr:Bro-N domain-containing protein [Alphaproteobacteria bacterium]